MSEKKFYFHSLLFALVWCIVFQNLTLAQTVQAQTSVSTAALKSEVRDFTAREIAAHFADIKTLNPPPDRVFSALTVGEFSWGSFARALAAQADIGGNQTIAGKDTARAVAEIGLIEARKGGKAFAQLYSTLALRHYGTDLSKNAVWQSLSDAEKKEWLELLDPARFYDAKKREVINLPENYLGVAARVSAMSFQMGILKDRAFLDSVVERAARQFLSGALYSDDNPPTGRYDRYSNEYARFCWDAAEIAGRRDIQEKLKLSLKEQMRLWWDLVSDKGYGYNWGRSQGLVSYLDTLEIAAFLGEHPEFRPASLEDIASVYNLAWRWIRKDYSDETHMFTVFAFGRGNYSYINKEREWQQTGTGFGKIIIAHDSFMKSLERENITNIPAVPKFNQTARFEFFEKNRIVNSAFGSSGREVCGLLCRLRPEQNRRLPIICPRRSDFRVLPRRSRKFTRRSSRFYSWKTEKLTPRAKAQTKSSLHRTDNLCASHGRNGRESEVNRVKLLKTESRAKSAGESKAVN